MFRDLGLAFAAVLVLIYVLVVGWFQSFKIPLVIMAPIPLTLIGILPGHALTGAFFTATSMIGMIALAGIIVRNSILLVDFIQLAEARGRPLREAVLEAGAVRFRPIALTAAAVVIGGLVMVLDPIFQGLAVALMSGAIVATLLTMVVVPLLYWELRRREGADNVKMLVLTYSGADPERVTTLLDDAGVPGHTCLEGGAGPRAHRPPRRHARVARDGDDLFRGHGRCHRRNGRDAVPGRATSPRRAAARGAAAGRLFQLALEVQDVQ